MQKPERVIIVGATGFIGRALCAHLESRGITAVKVGSKDVDLLDPGSAAKLQALARSGDACVFLSCLTPDKGKDTATVIKNVTMANHFAAFVSQAQLSHLVIVSSDAIYNDEQVPLRENSFCAPSSLYGSMHLVREQAVCGAAAAKKIPTAVIRPCAVYGAGDTHNSYGPNRFIRMALSERRIPLFGEGEEIRDHVFVDDVARLIGECLVAGSTGVFNAASGRGTSFGDVARMVSGLVEKKSGQPVKVEPQPRAPGPISHRHFDPTHVTRTFPQFVFTPLEAGLRTTLDRWT
jgi:nucleoside-diphosphate-sugar epimerase